jgi:hypothetical protein
MCFAEKIKQEDFMGFMDDVKKNGASALEGSGAPQAFAIGQGVFEGKLLSIVKHTSKQGKNGYKLTFKPATKYSPEGLEIKDVYGFWFLSNKEEMLEIALNAIRGEERRYTEQELENALANDEFFGRVYLVRSRVRDDSNEWGYPAYNCFVCPAKDVADMEKQFPPLPHLVIDEGKYRAKCAAMKVPPREDKIERSSSAQAESFGNGENDDNLPF